MPMQRFETVDAYIAALQNWQAEVQLLRSVLVSTKLVETVKWGQPCYQYDGKNVVGLGAFKAYFGLWFYDGASLSDSQSVLHNAQEGKTKALRQWRMTSANEIKPRFIKQYVSEAIKVVERGGTLKPVRRQAFEMPQELQTALNASRAAKKAFGELTQAKQREYAEYIATAKQAPTKLRRLEKIIPMIAERVGLNDHYRK